MSKIAKKARAAASANQTLSFKAWRAQFAAEYLRRVRCTIEESGAESMVQAYYTQGTSPENAVECEITHHDLGDFTESLFGWN